MRTRAAIVEMARGLNVMSVEAVETVDEALHERARALSGRPERKAEWLLAWAIDNVAQAMRRLDAACVEDTRRADNVRAMARNGIRFQEPSEFRGPEFSRVVDRQAAATAAQETLRRVLEMYEAMAVDIVADERA